MCKLSRRDEDPLLRRFLDVYGLHLLSRPRTDIDVAHVVIRQSGTTATVGTLEELLDGKIGDLKVKRGELMADVQGQLSNARETETGIGVSQALLDAMGAVGIGAKLSTTLASSKKVGLRFRFAEPTRDYVSPAALGARILRRKFNTKHPVFNEKVEFFVVTGVARSRSFEMQIEAGGSRSGELTVELAKLVESSGRVDVKRLDDSTLRFSGKEALGFGVELFAASVDGRQRMRLAIPQSPVKVRGIASESSTDAPSSTMIDGSDGDPILDLA